jgi:DNA repair protein RAD50
LQDVKIAWRDLQTLKGAAVQVTKALSDMRDLRTGISQLERDLQSSGSLKTVDEVQAESDTVNEEM